VAAGRDFIRRGLKWEIGDGSSIMFFQDPWIGFSFLKLWPNIVLSNEADEGISVKEFITPSRQWDQLKPNEAVDIEVAQIICRVPLPQSQVGDPSDWCWI